MHIYQGERDLQDKNQALAIPGGFQTDKDIAMSSEQLFQVRKSFNTTLDMILFHDAFIKQMFWKNCLALTSKF